MVSRFLTPFGGRPQQEDPSTSFLELPRELNQHQDDKLGEGAVRITPKLDVYEMGGQIEVTAELAGVADKDVELCLDGDILTISGEKRNTHKDQQAHFVERSYGVFERSIQLPFAPDPKSVQAESMNGVLSVRFPRVEPERSHRIPIGGRQAIGQDWSGGKPTEDKAKSGKVAIGAGKVENPI